MNSNLLKSIITLQGKTIKDVAKELNISKSAFYRKMYSKTEFTRAEISHLIKILDISVDKAMEIFFTEEVA